MTLRLGFCGSWWLCLLVVLVTLVLTSLGSWQLSRAEEKREVMRQHDRLSTEVPLTRIPEQPDVNALRHRQVQVTGQLDGAHQFLLDNQIRNGRVGYSVLTPFELTGGLWVLVDRGWVAQGQTRQLLPNVDVASEATDISGQLYAPYGEAYALGEFDQGSAGWPLVVQFLDFEGMAQRLGRDLLPITIRMSADSGPGYLREWSLVSMGPQKHIAYAVQWYSMAAVFLILVWLANRKRKQT